MEGLESLGTQAPGEEHLSSSKHEKKQPRLGRTVSQRLLGTR